MAAAAVVPRPDLSRLLAPASIAVVGATESSAWTQALLHNLRTLGYSGAIHAVNPRHSEVFGVRCHPSLAAIDGPVDCAYVMTGADAVPAVIEDLARAGGRAAIVLTSGYKETGPAGAEREARLVAACEEAGILLQGPNCLGAVSYRAGMAAYALPVAGPLIPGRVGIVTQSGALLLHLHRLAAARGIGLSYQVSSGNEAMLDAADFADHLLDDPETAVVGLLLEGIRRPGRFLALAERAIAAGKPLVVLKVGSSAAGARSAAAHTGALAGEGRVVQAVFAQKGIVAVRTPEELVETCALLASGRLPEGRRVAVLTASGGAAGLVGDLAAGTRVEIPDFGETTKAALREVLPDFATPQNPLDTTGLVVDDIGLLPAALAAIGGDPTFDAALLVWDPPRDAGLDPARTQRRLGTVAAAAGSAPLPVFITSYVAGDLTDFGRDALRRHGLHFANGIASAIGALDAAIGWTEARRRLNGRPRPHWPPISRPSLPARRQLTEVEGLALLAHYGLPTPPLRVARNREEAGRLADAAGYPAVVKVQSPDLAHKTEAGALRLNLLGRAEVEAAFDAVVAAALEAVPGARIEGVLVVPQVFPAAELILGLYDDADFGPVVLAGLGGILAEVIDDVAIRLPPLDFDEAVGMLAELRGRSLLEGARGLPRADIHAAATAIVRLGRMGVELAGEVEAVDVNPLFVLPDGEGAVAGDALVVLR